MLKWVALLLAVALDGAMSDAASAQAPYPSRPVRIVIGFGPADRAEMMLCMFGKIRNNRAFTSAPQPLRLPNLPSPLAGEGSTEVLRGRTGEGSLRKKRLSRRNPLAHRNLLRML